MINLRILAGALALCLVVPGAADAGCISGPQFSARVAAKLPRATTLTLGASYAGAFLAAFNRIPPATALTADEIVIVDQSGPGPNLRIALFERGCLTRLGTLPRAMVQSLLAAVARGGA